MKTGVFECDCGPLVYLAAAVVFLSLTSLTFLFLSIYFYKKSFHVSENIVRNRSRSFAFGERCKINSFTCLQLKKDKVSLLNEQKSEQGPSRPNDQKVWPKVKYRPGYVSNSSSGNFRRFEPKMYKLCSKLSLGRSNTISHSSYNSANEELEFDLYDYGHEHIGEGVTEPMVKNTWEMDDFSMTEFVPTKLFPSDDTIVNVNEVKSSSKISSMNDSPIPPRRGDYNQNIIESITSDLASSIMSDINLLESHKIQEPPKREQTEYLFSNTLETKQNHINRNSQDLVVFHKNRNGEEKTETLLEKNHVWANVATVPPNSVLQNTGKETKKTFPPITLIDELELWDDD